MRRRHCALLLASTLAQPALTQAAEPETIRRGRALMFPRDHGAHLAARTEWWYATGWLGRPDAPTHGFQVTFFRSRTGLAQQIQSRFAPRHLLFAHAAVTDLGRREHRHDQRIVRWNGIGTSGGAVASSDDLSVAIGNWTLRRDTAGGVTTYLASTTLLPSLRLEVTQPILLQGDRGFSHKGPDEAQASHYTSEPQLRAQAALAGTPNEGGAWLDHEWSDQILHPEAVGWDWIGINLFDGSALTAFRLRRADGSSLWAGGSFRPRDGSVRSFKAEEVRFGPGRRWSSPATAAVYPVQWQVESPAGRHEVRALLDAQELDSRASTGTVYWEGLSELVDGSGQRVGLGYLEMTGYAGHLRL